MICQTLHNVLGDENKESRIRAILRLCIFAPLRWAVGRLRVGVESYGAGLAQVVC